MNEVIENFFGKFLNIIWVGRADSTRPNPKQFDKKSLLLVYLIIIENQFS